MSTIWPAILFLGDLDFLLELEAELFVILGAVVEQLHALGLLGDTLRLQLGQDSFAATGLFDDLSLAASIRFRHALLLGSGGFGLTDFLDDLGLRFFDADLGPCLPSRGQGIGFFHLGSSQTAGGFLACLPSARRIAARGFLLSSSLGGFGQDDLFLGLMRSSGFSSFGQQRLL